MTALEALSELCRTRGLTLGTAESCTGGLIAARLTSRSGASAFFQGGFVCYGNAQKTRLLGVPAALLRRHGAVSLATAEAMARGARRALRVDAVVAVTGISGPEGGTPDKPVGTVCLAVATRGGLVSRRHRWAGNRARVRAAAVNAALRLLYAALAQPRAQP